MAALVAHGLQHSPAQLLCCQGKVLYSAPGQPHLQHGSEPLCPEYQRHGGSSLPSLGCSCLHLPMPRVSFCSLSEISAWNPKGLVPSWILVEGVISALPI